MRRQETAHRACKTNAFTHAGVCTSTRIAVQLAWLHMLVAGALDPEAVCAKEANVAGFACADQ